MRTAAALATPACATDRFIPAGSLRRHRILASACAGGCARVDGRGICRPGQSGQPRVDGAVHCILCLLGELVHLAALSNGEDGQLGVHAVAEV